MEMEFYKLMKNSIYGKKSENQATDIRLRTDKVACEMLYGKQVWQWIRKFNEHLLALNNEECHNRHKETILGWGRSLGTELNFHVRVWRNINFILSLLLSLFRLYLILTFSFHSTSDTCFTTFQYELIKKKYGDNIRFPLQRDGFPHV